MRLCKTLFLMLLLALVVTTPVWGQSATGKDGAKPSVSSAAADTKTPAATGGATGVGATSAGATGVSAGGTSAAAPVSAADGAAAPTTSSPPKTEAPSATPSAAPAAGAMDGSTYQVRLRDLEQRIDELKEQIRRSHTRLSLLSETILSGGTGGARAEISFINDMSSAFRMTQALFVLDGAVQYNKQDETGVLAGQKEIPIFSGSIPPGDHTLQVLVKLRGHGYGVFSYLQGYRFEIRSSHSFTVTEGKTIELKSIAFEKGDVTTPIEQRPAVRYHKNVRTGMDAGSAPGVDSKGAGGDARSSVSVSAGSK